jgi:hypothetical protein
MDAYQKLILKTGFRSKFKADPASFNPQAYLKYVEEFEASLPNGRYWAERQF